MSGNIIGGEMAGLAAAYYLAQAGKAVLVAKLVLSGTTQYHIAPFAIARPGILA